MARHPTLTTLPEATAGLRAAVGRGLVAPARPNRTDPLTSRFATPRELARE